MDEKHHFLWVCLQNAGPPNLRAVAAHQKITFEAARSRYRRLQAAFATIDAGAVTAIGGAAAATFPSSVDSKGLGKAVGQGVGKEVGKGKGKGEAKGGGAKRTMSDMGAEDGADSGGAGGQSYDGARGLFEKILSMGELGERDDGAHGLFRDILGMGKPKKGTGAKRAKVEVNMKEEDGKEEGV